MIPFAEDAGLVQSFRGEEYACADHLLSLGLDKKKPDLPDFLLGESCKTHCHYILPPGGKLGS